MRLWNGLDQRLVPFLSGRQRGLYISIIGTGYQVQILFDPRLLSRFVSGIQSAGNLIYQTSKVRILHAAEEDNLSPFDSKIAWLYQSIKHNNNRHVYCQSQVRKPTGSEVMWAKCSLIIGTWAIEFKFCLILDSSVSLWVGIRSAGSQTSKTRILHSAEGDTLSPFDSKIACLCQSININNNKAHGVRWKPLQKLDLRCRSALGITTDKHPQHADTNSPEIMVPFTPGV